MGCLHWSNARCFRVLVSLPVLLSLFFIYCYSADLCHRYDFLVCLNGTDLLFSNFFIVIFHLGLITTPHAHYVHMTYVYSLFLYVSSFTQLRGQEKSLSYYDLLFDLEDLFYGRIPTLIFFYFLHYPTTPILPVYVDQQRPHLEKDTTRTRSVVIQKISTVPKRTCITPD